VAKIRDSALVYLSGGDPHYLANTLRGTPVLDAIVANWISGGSLAGCSAGAMVMSTKIPNFRMSRSAPTEGFNLLPDIRVIPHFNKFFKWIPDSAAKILLDTPGDSVLLGIDELTALVRRSGEVSWRVHGEAKVHVLKGLPTQQLSHDEQVAIG
ncbi:MAG: Type 1 glutamine amidotransferase-like domain-containing protein, partial [Actinomycetota bacterium]